MSVVTLQLPPDTEKKLRAQAVQAGQTLEAYLQRLAERAASHGPPPSGTPSAAGGGPGGEPEEYPRYISDPRPTAAELVRLLGDLATGPRLPILPADFSRADIYDDHD